MKNTDLGNTSVHGETQSDQEMTMVEGGLGLGHPDENLKLESVHVKRDEIATSESS